MKARVARVHHAYHGILAGVFGSRGGVKSGNNPEAAGVFERRAFERYCVGQGRLEEAMVRDSVGLRGPAWAALVGMDGCGDGEFIRAEEGWPVVFGRSNTP